MRAEKEREEALNQIWVGGGSYGLETSFEAALKTGLNSASADYELHILEQFLVLLCHGFPTCKLEV